jgi:hypothetical protein
VTFAEVRNDTEIGHNNYVRVLDPRAAEISFVRTTCARREAFFLGCSHLECGKQSAFGGDKAGVSLPKMAMPGDWPFHVALFKKDTHVCDGTLVSSHWVLTTASCFQGQSKATWIAVFGNVRIGVTTPWTQKRRIVSKNDLCWVTIFFLKKIAFKIKFFLTFQIFFNFFLKNSIKKISIDGQPNLKLNFQHFKFLSS